jgi:hypothetical protein
VYVMGTIQQSLKPQQLKAILQLKQSLKAVSK